MFDYLKHHKTFLKMLKEQNISIVTADDYRKHIMPENVQDVLFFEDIKFSDNSSVILIERVGNKISIYDSNGKQRFFNKIEPNIIKCLHSSLLLYKPMLKAYTFNVFYKNRLPLIVNINATDDDNAQELLTAKLKGITTEIPFSVEKVK